jgi:EpsI family protein
MSSHESREPALLLLTLVLTGCVAWWLSFRTPVEFDANVFDSLPRELNGWSSVDVEIDEGVAALLRADHHVQRAYTHRLGYLVYVYVGYYGTERGGSPEHTPDVCYPSQGWALERDETVRIGGRTDGLAMREFQVEKGGETRLVHFWYRTQHSSGFTSTLSLRLRQFWGRLTTNRGDGALVRLSTPVLDDDLMAARLRLFGLDAAVEEALDRVWPDGLGDAGILGEKGARDDDRG